MWQHDIMHFCTFSDTEWKFLCALLFPNEGKRLFLSTNFVPTFTGGTDNPNDDDTSIFVTKIIPNGTAYCDGRLCVNDIITKVNDTPVVGVPHSTAVDALKRAGHRVTLCVKRKKNILPLGPNIMEIELSKGTKVIIIWIFLL